MQEKEMVTVSYDTLAELVCNDMYRMFVVFGSDKTFEEIKEFYADTDIQVDDKMLQYAYDVTKDLNNKNETDGWNTRHYPSRKTLESGQLSTDILLTVLEMMLYDKGRAAAPNAIAEKIHELMIAKGYEEPTAERMSDAAFDVSSALVADIGKYL